jgi:hypothetical protein
MHALIICDAERREGEYAAQKERDSRCKELMDRFDGTFRKLVPLAVEPLAADEYQQSRSHFAELARAIIEFNTIILELDKEYPRYRICERLTRAAHADVPSLDTAASLLLLNPASDVEEVTHALESLQTDQSCKLWPLWLTYILDQLFRSHLPPARSDNVPLDTTREQWRRAELAFGCVLFSDESFRVMHDATEHAATMIDAAMKAGGYELLLRPPGRVRDLLSLFDARALEWFSRAPQPAFGLLQPPPSIEAITAPESLRRELDEIWTAANCLEIALSKWLDWFCELSQRGDAHPAAALTCDEAARRAIKVLCVYRPNSPPFDREAEHVIKNSLPPVPPWWLRGTDLEPRPDGGKPIETPRVRWQEDRDFLNCYYWKPEQRMHKTSLLRGAAIQLIELLKSYPLAALRKSQSDAGRSEAEATPTQSARRAAPAAPTLKGPVLMTTGCAKRFRIALSFPGEQRSFVARVAEALAAHIGHDRVLYDQWYEAEFARPDLDTYLQGLYHDESELIAVFLCADYERKEWCGLEWRAIRDLIKRRQGQDVMPLRFDNTQVPGLFSSDGYVWIGERTPKEISDLILQRWEVNAAHKTAGSPQVALSTPVAPATLADSASTATILHDPEEILEELKRLPSAWFEQLVFRHDRDAAVPGKSEAQSARAIELLKVMRLRPDGLAMLHADIEHLKGPRE